MSLEEGRWQSAPHPIPWGKLVPFLLFRISDAVVYSVVFPMASDMVTSFGVKSDRIGLYAGMGEGALMLTEAIAAPAWARLADKYGRRPCLLWGFLGTVGTAAMVGFSSGVWGLIFWRAAFGLNPCGVISRIQVGEISHPSNRARLFAVFSPSFYVGLMLGGIIGGQLAHPYGRLLPLLGGESEFWQRWPYALPCIISAVVGLISIIYAFFNLVETQPERSLREPGEFESTRSSGLILATLRVPNYVLTTLVFCVFQLTTFAWEGILTVITYTSVEVGGYGLPVPQIGLLFSVGSVLYFSLTPFLLPLLTKRFGNTRSLKLIFSSWIMLALTIPLAQYAAKNSRLAMWTVLVLQLLAKNFGNFGWPMCDLLSINTFDDYPHLLATGSAITLIAGAGGRAIGPTLFGWLYSYSTRFEDGTFGRNIPWLALLVVCIPPVALVRFMPKDGPISKADEPERLPLVSEEVLEAPLYPSPDQGAGPIVSNKT